MDVIEDNELTMRPSLRMQGSRELNPPMEERINLDRRKDEDQLMESIRLSRPEEERLCERDFDP